MSGSFAWNLKFGIIIFIWEFNKRKYSLKFLGDKLSKKFEIFERIIYNWLKNKY